MDKSENKPITAGGDPNVVHSGDKVADEPQFEEEKAVSTKWKWVWRGICYVAEPDVEGRDESTAGEKVSVATEEGNTGDVKDVPTSSGVKRKIDSDKTDEPPEKKVKVSEDYDLDLQKMEL